MQHEYKLCSNPSHVGTYVWTFPACLTKGSDTRFLILLPSPPQQKNCVNIKQKKIYLQKEKFYHKSLVTLAEKSATNIFIRLKKLFSKKGRNNLNLPFRREKYLFLYIQCPTIYLILWVHALPSSWKYVGWYKTI